MNMTGELIKAPDDFFIDASNSHYCGGSTCAGCSAGTTVPSGPIIQRKSMPGAQWCLKCYATFPRHVLQAYDAACAAAPVPEPATIAEVPPAEKKLFQKNGRGCRPVATRRPVHGCGREHL